MYFFFLRAAGGKKGHRNRNTSMVPDLFVFRSVDSGRTASECFSPTVVPYSAL